MKYPERKQLTTYLFETALALGESKNKSYSDEADSLSNFKRNAELLGLTPYQVWSVYANKHIDSINNAVKNTPKLPVDPSESMEGRIIDVIVYLTILYCMLVEDGGISKKEE